MFELTNYDQHTSEYTALIEDIENDVYYEISHLLGNSDRLYVKDKYKCMGSNINIIYPQFQQPGLKKLLIDQGSIRFLLSLYPVKEDLAKIGSIIIRPRHIELNGIELVSLYMRKERALVLYLHHPYSYSTANPGFFEFSEVMRRTGLSNPGSSGLLYNNRDRDNPAIQVPPLWYFISTISCFPDDKIEKFFIRSDNKLHGSMLNKITDISFDYARLGY